MNNITILFTPFPQRAQKVMERRFHYSFLRDSRFFTSFPAPEALGNPFTDRTSQFFLSPDLQSVFSRSILRAETEAWNCGQSLRVSKMSVGPIMENGKEGKRNKSSNLSLWGVE